MKTTTTQMILGLAVAAAAGAAIGMLLAPEKGTDLQKRLRDGVRSFMDDMTAVLGAGRDVVESAAADAGAKVDEAASSIRRIQE